MPACSFCTRVAGGRNTIHRRPGYVLLLVLTTLVIAATALVHVANRSLVNSRSSLESVSALQSKWGRITLGRLILPAAANVFEALDEMKVPEARKRNPSWRVRDRVILGEQVFDLILSDEDAKLNLNALSSRAGPQAALLAAQDLIAPKYRSCLSVLPSSYRSSAAWESWGEVVDLARLRRLHGEDRALVELTDQVSLWGTGRLNIRRAADSAILAQCASVVRLGLAQRLVEDLRDATAGIEVELLLQRTVKNTDDRMQLRSLLNDGSSTYALWCETTARGGRRTQELVISSIDEAGLATGHRFIFE